MIKATQESNSELYTKLTQLYTKLAVQDTQDKIPNTNLADVAFNNFNSSDVRKELTDISLLLNNNSEYVCSAPVTSGEMNGVIILGNENGTLRTKRHKLQGDKPTTELYARSEIGEDYELHLVAVETKREVIKGNLELYIAITDKDNNIIADQDDLGYNTQNRLQYLNLVTELSKILQNKLKHHAKENPKELAQTFKGIDIELIFSTYASNTLKNIGELTTAKKTA